MLAPLKTVAPYVIKLDPPPGIEGDRVSSWSVLAPFKPDAFERLNGKVVNSPEEPDE